MRSDRLKPTRTPPRPDGTVRLWVEQLDCRCLPSVGSPDVTSLLGVGPGFGAATEIQAAPTQPPLPPPPPVNVSPETASRPDGGGPTGGFAPGLDVVAQPVVPYLPLPLPSPVFDGPLLALPEQSVLGRIATVDWGDGVITGATFGPGADGWLDVRVNCVLDGNEIYSVNVRLTAADDPKDWLNIPLQVLTPSAPPADGVRTWNATGYSPPVPVEVRPSEWLLVSLPDFEPTDPGPTPHGGGSGFTPPPPAPPPTPPDTTGPPAGLPAPDTTQAPPPDAEPDLPPDAPTDPAAPPVVHPASYSPFEAGATQAALATTPTAAPRTPPPDRATPRAGTRPANSRTDDKPPEDSNLIAESTPADEPASWDWVVALGAGPLDPEAAPVSVHFARSDRSEEASDRGAKDHANSPPAASENARGTPSDAGPAEPWMPPPEADRLLDPHDAPIARHPAHGTADGSPEAILAAHAGAPSPDAVFAVLPVAAESSEDRQQRWGWKSKAVALATAVWAGVWSLWPRLRPCARPVDPVVVVPDGPTPTRIEITRPAAPKSQEQADAPVAHS